MIVDYSLARPTIAELRAAGATGVIRYTGWDGQPGFANSHKNLTIPELAELRAAGLDVGLTFEYAADAAAHGAAQGTADAGLADMQIALLGMAGGPSKVGDFYAVDYDVPDFAPNLPGGPASARAKLGPLAGYFDAARAAAVNHEVCAYGGYWAVSRLLDAGIVRKAWQTLAWSRGSTVPAGATHTTVVNGVLWDTRAVLRQTGQTLLGGGLDVDTLEVQGQWPRPGHAPPPPPPPPATVSVTVTDPVLAAGASGPAVRRLQGLCLAAGHPIAVDGAFGGVTLAAVRAVQASARIAVDGVVGHDTWLALYTRP
jgi:peptidoglycan hydrolase-like protein with peptidoglycan-binding domain